MGALRVELKEVEEKIKKLAERELELEDYYLRDDKPIQLVFRQKPRPLVFLRAKPKTAYDPTVNQIRSRLRFAELARKARGRKFTGELPPAAEMVKQMKGERFGQTERPRKWEVILAEYLRRG
ncbi:MAG: hypothetical protein J7J61_04065 [Candidatus Hydrothermae bacterium]|nr:hypothetical protein [Candidatus Hydrothermae bacterium]